MNKLKPLMAMEQPIELLIREATRQDLTSILSLYTQPDLDDGEVLCLEHAEHQLEKIWQYPNYRIYVVRMGSLIVGTFALLIMDNLIHCGQASGIVEAVAVDPEFQGRGIGKQMMLYAISRCREFGCYKITLSANLKRLNAHEFYESLGFEKHGYSYIANLASPNVPDSLF